VSFQSDTKLLKEYANLKIKCKNCNHPQVIPKFVSKAICTWCGFYIYRDKKLEFKDRVKEKLKCC